MWSVVSRFGCRVPASLKPWKGTICWLLSASHNFNSLIIIFYIYIFIIWLFKFQRNNIDKNWKLSFHFLCFIGWHFQIQFLFYKSVLVVEDRNWRVYPDDQRPSRFNFFHFMEPRRKSLRHHLQRQTNTSHWSTHRGRHQGVYTFEICSSCIGNLIIHLWVDILLDLSSNLLQKK